MYSIKDILKKSFLEGYTANDISVQTVAVALLLTAALSLYIFFVYRIITRKTFYSKNFNISLVGVAMITAAIIVTIQSSIVVSLGMVGALSIVRFRTAVKEPMDLMFLFWSISTGIMCGAGFAEFAIILAVLLTVVILILEKLPLIKGSYLLIVNCDNSECEEKIIKVLEDKKTSYKLCSKNMTSTTVDLTIELRSHVQSELVNELMKISGVQSASILEHSGETNF